MGDMILTALILLFATIPLLRWHAVFVLSQARRAAKEANGGVGIFTERLIVAFTGAIGSTLLGTIGLNRLLGYPLWDQTSPIGFMALIVALILFSAPAL